MTERLRKMLLPPDIDMLTDFECPPTPGLIDRDAVLDRVGGDIGLLREIVGIFLAEYPVLLADIREAVARGDAPKLERAAHSLKGAVSNFAVPAATQSAYRLEMLGRLGDLKSAQDGMAALEGQLAALQPALAALITE